MIILKGSKGTISSDGIKNGTLEKKRWFLIDFDQKNYLQSNFTVNNIISLCFDGNLMFILNCS